MRSDVLAAGARPSAYRPRPIGHVSGFGVPSDLFARYLPMVATHVV